MLHKILKFCSWNIQGYNSRILGNKFEDKEFLQRFENIDFIGVTETHMHSEIIDRMNVPGFYRLDHRNQEKNKKSNTASKGVAVFVKEGIKNLFTPIKMGNDDAIWVKMKKEISGECRDIFIGVFYLSPSRNQRMDQRISKLSENVIDLQKKGEVILMGDFNARTGNLGDTVSPDKYDEFFELELSQPPLKRNSRDCGIDSRGKELLDVCKSLDLYIANGRKPGDLFGDYTCIKHNGNSVVDYLVTSSFQFRKVTSLKVGEFFPLHGFLTIIFYSRNTNEYSHSSPGVRKEESPKALYLG